ERVEKIEKGAFTDQLSEIRKRFSEIRAVIGSRIGYRKTEIGYRIIYGAALKIAILMRSRRSEARALSVCSESALSQPSGEPSFFSFSTSSSELMVTVVPPITL